MENKSTIFRVIKNKDYTVVCNVHLRDDSLSWGAKGLLTYLLTLPDDNKIYLNELTNHTKDGITKTSTLIKELINSGYIKRERIKSENGKFTEYKYSILKVKF